ncbi:filamentous hemagglutinin N-terminal domain-containing protein, partial [Salmonella enterica]|nr:filamentous hemagglutinin N-terminal domain-containing protein [Salmonella enterica]
MNKIYKLKFDKRRNELVVVSEITAGMGKEKSTGHIADLAALSPFRKLLGTLTPLAFLTGLVISLFPGMALANPDLPAGGQIVGGQGSISTSGSQMTIHQQTQNMAANWHSFDIGKNNTVTFVQPDSSSVALNRVTGGSASQIMGTLNANGKVFLINPNGVLFGKGASVNTAGLVASTRNISTADFMQGNYTLSGGGGGAEIINQGSLTTTKGGFIVLAADRVSNQGTLTTPSGRTVLAAADTVTLQLDNGGLTSVRVNGSVVNALAENRGLISATNGQVFLTAQGRDMLLKTVVNNSGTIEAGGLESRGGEIVLNGGDSGVVSQSGRLLADSRGGRGGKITLEGQNIHLADNSLISATGSTGGGEVHVGGGWQGKDSRIRNASKVVMDKHATVDVSATERGDGGTAVLWSDDYTSFRGTVLAQGGAQSGNGGRVETSSHNNLQAFGTVDASAPSPAGRGGEWLLDPTDVTIVAGESNTGVRVTGKDAPGDAGLDTDTVQTFAPSADGARIGVSSITAQLSKGTDVTVTTSGKDVDGQSGNITLATDISTDIASGTAANLTLRADRDITLNGNITTAGSADGSDKGTLNVNLLASGTTNGGTVNLGCATVSLNGGDLVLDSAGIPEDDSTAADTIKVLSGAANLTVGNLAAGNVSGWTTAGLNVSAAGNITVNSAGLLSLAGDTYQGGGNISLLSTGGILLNGTSLTGANVAANGSQNSGTGLDIRDGSRLNATTGDITLTGSRTGGEGSGISVSGDNSLTAGHNITVTGTALNGKPGGLLVSGNTTLDAENTVLAGISQQNNVGAKLSGNISATRGNLSISGQATRINTAGGVTGVLSGDTLNISSSGTLNITGCVAESQDFGGGSEAGVNLTNATLNAAVINVTGTSQSGGKGFILNNVTLTDSAGNTPDISLSSAGSGSSVSNLIGANVLDAATTDKVISQGIENNTQINMTGVTPGGAGGDWTLSDSGAKGGRWTLDGAVVSKDNIVLSGVNFVNSSLTANDNLSLNAVGGEGNGVLVQNSTLSGSSVSVNGSTASVSPEAYGVSLQNVTLNAAKADVTGVATNTAGGAGFILANMTLQGGVDNLSNLTLNSSGSSAGTVNSLDGSIIRSGTDLADIMSRDTGSTTAVEASSLTLTFDSNGWDNTGAGAQPEGDTSAAILPSGMNTAHDWVLNNATVQSEGNVTLKGVSFSNSTLNVTGVLNLSSANWLTLRGDVLNATQGVVLNGTTGMTLGGLTGNSALAADTAALTVYGNLSNATLNVSGDAAVSGSQSLTLTNVTLNGTSSGSLNVTTGGTLTVSGGSLSTGNISVTGKTINLSSGSGTLLLNATGGDLNISLAAGSNGGLTTDANTTLTATGNIALGANSSTSGTALKIQYSTVTAGHDLTVEATGGSGSEDNVVQIMGGHLNATTGNISINASSSKRTGGGHAVTLHGGPSLKAGQNITVTGTLTGGNGKALEANGNANLTAGS